MIANEVTGRSPRIEYFLGQRIDIERPGVGERINAPNLVATEAFDDALGNRGWPSGKPKCG
jgi:hypothetical protein